MSQWIHQHFWLSWIMLVVIFFALMQFLWDLKKEHKKQKEHKKKINGIEL